MREDSIEVEVVTDDDCPGCKKRREWLKSVIKGLIKPMPSTSKKQKDFMAAVANNPKFAKKVDVPVSVGREFHNADKRVAQALYERNMKHGKK